MGDAFALETRISGRLMYGAAFRMEDPNPELMVAYNAAAVGLTGLANSGQNTDDANLNFRRGDATTRCCAASSIWRWPRARTARCCGSRPGRISR
ncbi:DUF1302 family protein [Massilia sp. B-10]|nr:DUF1302 family protein [Massilia sp. B-10]